MAKEKRVISIYTGSFKPPHAGHFYVIKKMLALTKKENGYVYVFISNKPRYPCCKITGDVSKTILNYYILHLLPINDQKRVKIIKSKLTSPIQTAYGFLKNIIKKGDYIYLVKSSKDSDNSRYSSFQKLNKKGITFNKLILPGFKDMSSVDVRKYISQNNKNKFYKYLPNKLSNMEKNKLWKNIKLLCI